jgi:hypothetical protein
MADFSDAFAHVCRGCTLLVAREGDPKGKSLARDLLKMMVVSLLKVEDVDKREKLVRENAHLLIVLFTEAGLTEADTTPPYVEINNMGRDALNYPQRGLRTQWHEGRGCDTLRSANSN